MAITMETQDIEVVRQQALTWPEKVKALSIRDKETFEQANSANPRYPGDEKGNLQGI